MKKRYGLKWLNFLYSFFQLEVFVKSFLAIGTIVTVIQTVRTDEAESFFMLDTVLSFFACLLLLVECAVKLIACISSGKAGGYKLLLYGLLFGFISGVFYMTVDQGLAVGAFFMIPSGLWAGLNYLYLKKRKDVFGNPDLL